MDMIWKWVMRLNAKAFCLASALIFLGVTGWCGYRILIPPAPLKDGREGELPKLEPAWLIGTLDIVTNQLASESLSIPVDPFRPTLESIFTNETERASFLKALRAAQLAAAGGVAEEGKTKKEDPFAHLRKRAPAPDGLTGPDGQPMVIPKLTFLGFFERPDGTKAALFHDSTDSSTVFYEAGKKVHGVAMLDANVREAEIRFPDGTTRKLPIGASVELAAEPDKRPPKKTPPAAKAPGALKAGKEGKPGADKREAAKKQPAQKPAARLPNAP